MTKYVAGEADSKTTQVEQGEEVKLNRIDMGETLQKQEVIKDQQGKPRTYNRFKTQKPTAHDNQVRVFNLVQSSNCINKNRLFFPDRRHL